MNPKQLAIVASVVAVVLIAIIVLLVTGEPPPGIEAEDAAGDVVLTEGDQAPADTSLADIHEARVHLVASQIVFEAAMGAPIPRTLKGQTMGWRWEVSEGGSLTWLVTANISVGKPVAALTAQRKNYGISTFEENFPGGVDYDGNTIFIRLNQPDIPDFPTSFTWKLKTTLDGNRADAASATATDEAPDGGFGEYPPP